MVPVVAFVGSFGASFFGASFGASFLAPAAPPPPAAGAGAGPAPPGPPFAMSFSNCPTFSCMSGAIRRSISARSASSALVVPFAITLSSCFSPTFSSAM